MKSYFVANLAGTAVRTEGEEYKGYRESSAEKAYFGTSIFMKFLTAAAGVGSVLLLKMDPTASAGKKIKSIMNSKKKSESAEGADKADSE